MAAVHILAVLCHWSDDQLEVQSVVIKSEIIIVG